MILWPRSSSSAVSVLYPAQLLWHSLGEVIAKAVPRVGDDKATKAIFKHLIEQGEQGEQGCNRRGSREQYEEGPQSQLAVGLQSAVISQSCDWVLGLHLLLLLQLASLTAPIYLVCNQLGQAGPMHVSGQHCPPPSTLHSDKQK